jgi:hypothetical protein
MQVYLHYGALSRKYTELDTNIKLSQCREAEVNAKIATVNVVCVFFATLKMLK